MNLFSQVILKHLLHLLKVFLLLRNLINHINFRLDDIPLLRLLIVGHPQLSNLIVVILLVLGFLA